VLLSAIAGRAARRVLQVADLIVVTTDVNRAEVEEYLPEFAERYGLAEDLLHETLLLLPIEWYDADEYGSHVDQARRFIGDRDEDDVPLAALALKLGIPVWSNDRDFENFPHGVFTTAKLLKILGM
jgi:predicted nucleic acid-binding protein